ERRCRQRSAPIGVSIVALVIDRSKYPERVVYTVIDLTGKVVKLLINPIDKAVDFGGRGIESIIEPRHVGAAAGAEMRLVAPTRVDRGVEFVPNRPRNRL